MRAPDAWRGAGYGDMEPAMLSLSGDASKMFWLKRALQVLYNVQSHAHACFFHRSRIK